MNNITHTLEESLECSICLVLFKDPKLLHCGHTFCLSCVEKMMSTTYGARVVVCPHCREKTIVPPHGLPTNYLIGELAAKVNEVHLKTVDAPTCFMCQAVLPTADIVICRTCANVQLCSLCVFKCHKDHDTEFMNAYKARRRVANARALIRCQRDVCRTFADHIADVCARNHIAKEGRVEEAVKKISNEFDVLLAKLVNDDSYDGDEKGGTTLSADELCALVHCSNQISASVDGIYARGVQLIESIRNFFKEVVATQLRIEQHSDLIGRPGPADLQELMNVLDADEKPSEVGDVATEPLAVNELLPCSSAKAALSEVLPIFVGENEEVSSTSPARWNTFAYRADVRYVPRRIRRKGVGKP